MNYLKLEKYYIYFFNRAHCFNFFNLRIDFENNSNVNFGEDFTDYLGQYLTSRPYRLAKRLKQKDTVRVFYSFYWHYGRLKSTDSTTNWRLDIWQDIFYGMVEEEKLLKAMDIKSVPSNVRPDCTRQTG